VGTWFIWSLSSCGAIESIRHLLFGCTFVGVIWDWFQSLIVSTSGCARWVVNVDFVLYGLSPPACSSAVHDMLLLIVATSIRRHVWGSRCRLVFEGVVCSAESLVSLVKSDLKVRMDADFARLTFASFGRRWRAPVVYYRDGVPCLKL